MEITLPVTNEKIVEDDSPRSRDEVEKMLVYCAKQYRWEAIQGRRELDGTMTLTFRQIEKHIVLDTARQLGPEE